MYGEWYWDDLGAVMGFVAFNVQGSGSGEMLCSGAPFHKLSIFLGSLLCIAALA